jgi:phosphoribosylanthranilate isomerase
MRTRVKICGITRVADALVAAECGADAIGLVFYQPSPRCVDIATAAAIAREMPPFVTTVGLFVNAAADAVARVAGEVRIDLLQFHGDESPAFCRDQARPWIRALRMQPGIDLAAEIARYDGARGVLLDAYRPGVPGGTGETFDWGRVPVELAGRIVLAGGLGPDNVANAIRQVRPFAVDVSGGVEREKGVKDADRIKRFIDEVRSAE